MMMGLVMISSGTAYLDYFGVVFSTLQSQRFFFSEGIIPRYNPRTCLSALQLYLSLGSFTYKKL